MNEKSFEAKLARVSAPAPDPEARLRAKRAALEEFARVHAANQATEKTSEAPSKGLWDALRLFRDDSSHGSTSMAWFVRRNLFAGVAGACVVGLGIAMVWPILSRYGDSRLLDDLQPPVRRRGAAGQGGSLRPALSKTVEPAPRGVAPPEPRQEPPACRLREAGSGRTPAQEKDKEAERYRRVGPASADAGVHGSQARRGVGRRRITAEDIGKFPIRTLPRHAARPGRRSRKRVAAPATLSPRSGGSDRHRRARVARQADPA